MVQYIYTLGAAGERLYVAELGRTVEYTYDNLYRLTGETITEGENVTAYTYSYDNVGNRILKTKNDAETEYTYNELNQLVSDSDATYEYDLNGNLVRVIGGAQAALYEYNSENKLVKATVQQGVNVVEETYTYDYAGNRTSKTTSTSDGNFEVVKYLNDNSSLTNVLAEINSEGEVSVYYTIGADLISQERDGKTYTYLYDGHGSVVGIMSESGSVTDTYTYDAFGNLLKSTGRTANNYRYCGEQFDSTTGLYYLRARYMDTSTGRFISQDSYAGSAYNPVSLHKYLYCNADPVNNIDPSGHFALAGTIIVGAVIGIISSIAIRYLGNVFAHFDETGEWNWKWNLSASDLCESIILGGSLGALSSIALFCQFAVATSVLIISALGFGGASAVSGYKNYKDGNYTTAIFCSVLAITSLWGAGRMSKALNSWNTYNAVENTSASSGNNSPSDNVKTNDYKFQNDNKFDKHFDKHVIKQKEFGNITQEEYLVKCNDFINNGADTKLVKTAQNGDVLMYDVFTDEFCIITEDGVIRTYYKLNPDVHGYETNLDYWNSDKCNY